MEEEVVRTFWGRIDMLLDRRKATLRDMSNATGIKYNTLAIQRTRHSLPNSEQLYEISQYLNLTMEFILTGKEEKGYPPRIQTIADHCLTAPEDDLRLVEKVLGIVHEDKKTESSSALA